METYDYTSRRRPSSFSGSALRLLAAVHRLSDSVDKFDDIARYDGSVYPDRTGGEVSAKCDKEAMNFLALNLFNEVVLGQRSIENARVYYAATAAKYNKEHITSPYTEGLLFPKQYHTADPDVSVM